MTTTPDQDGHLETVSIAADIVAAYVSNNPLPVAELPKLIGDIHGALKGIGAAAIEPVVTQEPAVSVRKRHIGVHYNLSPDQYRQKWKLPADYPMVAPAYAASRSALAKSIGLGRKAAPSAPVAAAKTKRPVRAAAANTAATSVKSPVRKARKARAKA